MKNSSAKTLQSSLRSANFILLVLGQGISLFGNTMLRAGHIRHSDHTY